MTAAGDLTRTNSLDSDKLCIFDQNQQCHLYISLR